MIRRPVLIGAFAPAMTPVQELAAHLLASAMRARAVRRLLADVETARHEVATLEAEIAGYERAARLIEGE